MLKQISNDFLADILPKMTAPKIAVVTGSNKGIGYAIVRGLCKNFDGIVYLTSRNVERGQDAVRSLQEEGLSPNFHQLDIDDVESIETFAFYIRKIYGGIDILVNNAGIVFYKESTEPAAEQALKTVTTNYYGTLHVCEKLFPLLRENARVVNVSSSLGHLSYIPHENLREKMANVDMTVDDLSEVMNNYLNSCKEGENEAPSWGKNSYVVSKVGICALTRIHQAQFDKEEPNRNIAVNSVHPGFVDTDMNNHTGTLSIDEGAKAPLYLCLTDHGLKGEFVWFDNTVVDWLAPTHPCTNTS